MGKKTRGPRGSGSIHKKTVTSKGHTYSYFEGRIITGYDPGSGKPIIKGFTGKTQAEVRKEMTAAVAQIDDGTYIEPCKFTISQWLDIWTESYFFGIKPHTQSSYKAVIKNHLKPNIGAIPLDELNAHTIQNMYNKLLTKGLSAKTIKNVHGVLHKALNQAIKNQYIRFNPCDACELPRGVKKEIHLLDDSEVNAFLEAIKGNEYEDLYRVTLFTGMREGEVLGLSWKDIDFNDGVITVRQQLQKKKEKGGQYYLAPLKNDKPRKITPATFVMEILKHHRARQAELRLSRGKRWTDWKNADLVFTDDLGCHLAIPTVYETFKRIVTSIGRPDARFHDLRHTYAVTAIRAGIDIKTISTNLGHATVAFTLDVYGHVTPEMHRESAEKMEAFIQHLYVGS